MTGGDMRAAMAAMHGLCRRRRRELTVIGISTPYCHSVDPRGGAPSRVGGREDLLILHGVLDRAREQHEEVAALDRLAGGGRRGPPPSGPPPTCSPRSVSSSTPST
jgi:hypothetical protein